MITKIKDYIVSKIKQNYFPLNYTCNVCEKEVFDKEYFCQDCKKELYKIDENRCNHCGRKTPYKVEYCDSCVDKNLDFYEARSLYEYKGSIQAVIKRLKYNEKTYLADLFINDLANLYYSRFMNCDVVISVPMTKSAIKQRGYNQSEIIAKKLAKVLDLPYSNQIVVKVKETERQATLDVTKRLENLKGAFKVDKSKLKYKNVLLIDDVLTTGTTCNLISQLLVKKGVEKVFVLTLASVQKENND
jgi:ComF family protein